jgi:CheY-like chemotaxis protein
MPRLFLLDRHMPRVDRREALIKIKSDPALRHIPIIMLASSSADEDIARSYHAGFSPFIERPNSFSAFVEIVLTLGHYWFSIVGLPGGSA